jgi:hypothetical protein
MSRRSALLAGSLVAAVAGLGAAQLLPGAAPSAQASGLVGYDGCDELLAHYRTELTRSATAYGFGFGGGFGVADDVAGAPMASSGAAREQGGPDAVGSGPTGTNVQEQGVDEPDLVKMRDGRLVVLTGNRVRVLSAEEQPRLLGSLRVGGDDSYGGELLLDGDRALAIVPGSRSVLRPGDTLTEGTARSMIYHPGIPTTRLLLLDLSGDQPRLVEEATYDAQYVSARLVEGTVRLVTATRPQPLPYATEDGMSWDEDEALRGNQQRASSVTLSEVLPQVVHTSANGTVLERGHAVSCDRTYHARTPTGVSTLLVTTMRPGDGLAPTDRTAVTTDGDLVYAATDRLYVATSRWGTVGPVTPLAGAVAPSGRLDRVDEVSTELHAFDTSSATGTRYVGTGRVDGYVMGRWALSRHDGALRVATTRQPPWDGGQQGESSSMVVKLVEKDGRLVETGRVEGLGRTEQIKAVRYFGDVAAVVTFRQTDPLYLLDLSGTPRVLGELKIPGFSTYLHPIGDGFLLGLGQDATADGRVTGVQASVFDISDLSRPTQVDRVHLGPGWTPALDDSRAFTYDPDRRLAAFPFAGYDAAAPEGQPFGAVGVTVDEDGNLREAGRLALDQYSYAGRVLLDDQNMYAVSETGVVAADADSWRRTGSVSFGAPVPLPYAE